MKPHKQRLSSMLKQRKTENPIGAGKMQALRVAFASVLAGAANRNSFALTVMPIANKIDLFGRKKKVTVQCLENNIFIIFPVFNRIPVAVSRGRLLRCRSSDLVSWTFPG
jgi:hypothetical protein